MRGDVPELPAVRPVGLTRPAYGLSIVLCLAFLAAPAAGEEPTAAAAPAAGEVPAAHEPREDAVAQRPSAVIRRLNATLLELMKQADELGYKGRTRKIEPVVRASYDLPSMARISLGKHWRRLEPEEREHFVDLFTRLTVANYAGRFDGYAGERFVIASEKDAPQGLRLVQSRIIPLDDEAVQIDYRLRPIDGSWRIVDVHLNATVSELAMRRAEYTSLVNRKGYSALLETLEAKIETLAGGEKPAP